MIIDWSSQKVYRWSREVERAMMAGDFGHAVTLCNRTLKEVATFRDSFQDQFDRLHEVGKHAPVDERGTDPVD
jgi:hypothetical protein